MLDVISNTCSFSCDENFKCPIWKENIQNQDHEAEGAKLISAIIDFIYF